MTLVAPRKACHSSGFTLTEVMVGLLIMVVLMAIALPALLSPTNAAADLEAKTNLDAVVSAQRILYRDGGGYSHSDYRLRDHAPDIHFTAGQNTPSDGTLSPAEVSVYIQPGVPAPDAVAGMAALSRSGVCWLVRLQPTGAARGATYAFNRNPRLGECNGANAVALDAALPGDDTGRSWDSPVQVD